VPVYQVAYAGNPWYEVSKCADTEKTRRCAGGLSSLALGQTCEICGNSPSEAAYKAEELIKTFKEVAERRPSTWYTEEGEVGLTLAAFAWTATPLVIANEKYSDVPAMKDWLSDNFGSNNLLWLDEIFADLEKSPSGNLANFKQMCLTMAKSLECQTIAFRTKNERLLSSVKNNFGEKATVYGRLSETSKEQKLKVPDRRDFVVIDLDEVEQ